MIIIGVTGMIAAGKTAVTRLLAQLGAEVIDADQLGHEVLDEPEVQRALRARWGDSAFDDQGQVDRRAIGQRVFGPAPDGPRDRKWLERLTHPRIERRMLDKLGKLASLRDVNVVVIDAPLLREADWDRHCDLVVLVHSAPEVRWQRVRARGWARQQLEAREAAQHAAETKRRANDVVIENSGDLEATERQVRQLWQRLQGDENPGFLENYPSRGGQNRDND